MAAVVAEVAVAGCVVCVAGSHGHLVPHAMHTASLARFPHPQTVGVWNVRLSFSCGTKPPIQMLWL